MADIQWEVIMKSGLATPVVDLALQMKVPLAA